MKNIKNCGKIYSISISTQRGQLKHEVPEANMIKNYGIENDGHAGNWGRQVTCLAWESICKVNRENNLTIGPGDFAENILIEGLDCQSLLIGNQLKIGTDIILEITQIGKEDHPSIVSETFGVSLLPSEGIFCKVIQGGVVRKGDAVSI